MAYAPSTDFAGAPHSAVATFIAECKTFFQLLAAAQRVACAVEQRRQPDRADLNTLNIKGPIPLASL